MINVVSRKLIAKELHVNRWLVTGAAVASVVALFVCLLGKTGFSIGSLTWLTSIIAFGVILAIYGIMNERKEQSLQFVLSLPLSIADYVRAKMLGLMLCFLVVWGVASAGAMLLIFTSASVPDGLAPYTVLLCVFMLANYSVVLCGTLHARSEALISGVIIVTNMGVSIFMFTVGPLPGIQQYIWQATPVWNSTFWTVLTCELAVLVIAFTLPFVFAARRRDFL